MHPNSTRRRPLVDRFWEMVNKCGPTQPHCTDIGPCWQWMAAPVAKGYGQLHRPGSTPIRAHRLSWILHNGPIPDGLWVLHKCDNKRCVNPSHLFLGTNQDNMDDYVAKGKRVFGEKHHLAKLTDEIVRDIRNRHARGSAITVLAKELNLSLGIISMIVNRKRWTHI